MIDERLRNLKNIFETRNALSDAVKDVNELIDKVDEHLSENIVASLDIGSGSDFISKEKHGFDNGSINQVKGLFVRFDKTSFGPPLKSQAVPMIKKDTDKNSLKKIISARAEEVSNLLLNGQETASELISILEANSLVLSSQYFFDSISLGEYFVGEVYTQLRNLFLSMNEEVAACFIENYHFTLKQMRFLIYVLGCMKRYGLKISDKLEKLECNSEQSENLIYVLKRQLEDYHRCFGAAGKGINKEIIIHDFSNVNISNALENLNLVTSGGNNGTSEQAKLIADANVDKNEEDINVEPPCYFVVIQIEDLSHERLRHRLVVNAAIHTARNIMVKLSNVFDGRRINYDDIEESASDRLIPTCFLFKLPLLFNAIAFAIEVHDELRISSEWPEKFIELRKKERGDNEGYRGLCVRVSIHYGKTTLREASPKGTIVPYHEGSTVRKCLRLTSYGHACETLVSQNVWEQYESALKNGQFPPTKRYLRLKNIITKRIEVGAYRGFRRKEYLIKIWGGKECYDISKNYEQKKLSFPIHFGVVVLNGSTVAQADASNDFKENEEDDLDVDIDLKEVLKMKEKQILTLEKIILSLQKQVSAESPEDRASGNELKGNAGFGVATQNMLYLHTLNAILENKLMELHDTMSSTTVEDDLYNEATTSKECCTTAQQKKKKNHDVSSGNNLSIKGKETSQKKKKIKSIKKEDTGTTFAVANQENNTSESQSSYTNEASSTQENTSAGATEKNISSQSGVSVQSRSPVSPRVLEESRSKHLQDTSSTQRKYSLFFLTHALCRIVSQLLKRYCCDKESADLETKDKKLQKNSTLNHVSEEGLIAIFIDTFNSFFKNDFNSKEIERILNFDARNDPAPKGCGQSNETAFAIISGDVIETSQRELLAQNSERSLAKSIYGHLANIINSCRTLKHKEEQLKKPCELGMRTLAPSDAQEAEEARKLHCLIEEKLKEHADTEAQMLLDIEKDRFETLVSEKHNLEQGLNMQIEQINTLREQLLLTKKELNVLQASTSIHTGTDNQVPALSSSVERLVSDLVDHAPAETTTDLERKDASYVADNRASILHDEGTQMSPLSFSTQFFNVGEASIAERSTSKVPTFPLQLSVYNLDEATVASQTNNVVSPEGQKTIDETRVDNTEEALDTTEDICKGSIASLFTFATLSPSEDSSLSNTAGNSTKAFDLRPSLPKVENESLSESVPCHTGSVTTPHKLSQTYKKVPLPATQVQKSRTVSSSISKFPGIKEEQSDMHELEVKRRINELDKQDRVGTEFSLDIDNNDEIMNYLPDSAKQLYRYFERKETIRPHSAVVHFSETQQHTDLATIPEKTAEQSHSTERTKKKVRSKNISSDIYSDKINFALNATSTSPVTSKSEKSSPNLQNYPHQRRESMLMSSPLFSLETSANAKNINSHGPTNNSETPHTLTSSRSDAQSSSWVPSSIRPTEHSLGSLGKVSLSLGVIRLGSHSGSLDHIPNHVHSPTKRSSLLKTRDKVIPSSRPHSAQPATSTPIHDMFSSAENIITVGSSISTRPILEKNLLSRSSLMGRSIASPSVIIDSREHKPFGKGLQALYGTAVTPASPNGNNKKKRPIKTQGALNKFDDVVKKTLTPLVIRAVNYQKQ